VTLAQGWALPFLRAGRQTIVFGRSRVAVEILLTGLRESLRESYGPRSKVRGYRGGDNPARWKDHLEHLLPARGEIQKTNHHAALPYTEIPAFWSALNVRKGVGAQALKFTILTAVRSGEALGATWDEFDLAEKTWTIPAARMKGQRAHRVPLSQPALEILNALPREDGNSFVFVGHNDRLGKSGMSKVLERMGRTDVTTHGFRFTFRDWAAERTNYPNHVVEMALAHVIGNKVESAYRRGDLFDKRRNLMAEWARYCATKPITATVGEVVPTGGRDERQHRSSHPRDAGA
jgi:integrase